MGRWFCYQILRQSHSNGEDGGWLADKMVEYYAALASASDNITFLFALITDYWFEVREGARSFESLFPR